MIEKPKVNGVEVDKRGVINEEILSYKDLYRDDENWRPSFQANCSRLSAKDSEWLHRPFPEEEVEYVIRSC